MDFAQRPMLRPDLFDLTDYAVSSGVPVCLSPSVTPLLNAEMISRIAASGVKAVSVSLDGACATTHDGVRGIPGHFTTTTAAISGFTAAGVRVQVNTTVMACNSFSLGNVRDQPLRDIPTHTRDNSPKPATPIANTRRFAEDVAERPADQDQRAQGEQVGVGHPLLACQPPPRSERIAGSVTFTAVASSPATNEPMVAASRASRCRRLTPSRGTCVGTAGPGVRVTRTVQAAAYGEPGSRMRACAGLRLS